MFFEAGRVPDLVGVLVANSHSQLSSGRGFRQQPPIRLLLLLPMGSGGAGPLPSPSRDTPINPLVAWALFLGGAPWRVHHPWTSFCGRKALACRSAGLSVLHRACYPPHA